MILLSTPASVGSNTDDSSGLGYVCFMYHCQLSLHFEEFKIQFGHQVLQWCSFPDKIWLLWEQVRIKGVGRRPTSYYLSVNMLFLRRCTIRDWHCYQFTADIG
jgi:hypothetical protein